MSHKDALVQMVVDCQASIGLNDVGMAKKIGVDQSTWSQLKAGDRGAGADFLCLVLLAFPEKTTDVLVYMKQRAMARLERKRADQNEDPK